MGIGEVSRDEAEYDFAILFRPSKEEEVPDAPCDIPVTVGSRLYFKQNPQRAKDHIIQKLKESGLDVKRLRAIDGKQTLVKVKAPQHVLEVCLGLLVCNVYLFIQIYYRSSEPNK